MVQIATAAERLNALVEHMHTNVKALSEICGYERPQAFYDIQRGKTRNISAAMCDKILSVFPNINRVWLLTGEGYMLNDHKPVEQPGGVHQVPMVHISALAGPLASYLGEGEDVNRAEKIWCLVPQAELAVPVSGDSMEPIIPDGSIAFIKRINERAFIPWGQTMVVETENGVFIKRVMPDADDEDYVLAESINPKYPAMRIPKQSIFSMYRVLSVSKMFHAS